MTDSAGGWGHNKASSSDCRMAAPPSPYIGFFFFFIFGKMTIERWTPAKPRVLFDEPSLLRNKVGEKNQ